jgi:hypothetical protein
MRHLQRFNIDIPQGSNTGELRSLKMDAGEYTRMQIINRFNTNVNTPIEIQVQANSQDVVPKVDTRALDVAGGDFYESKAPVYVTGSETVDIYLTAASALTTAGSYQVIFFKEC